MYLKLNNLLRKTDQCETRQNGLGQPKKCPTADAWLNPLFFTTIVQLLESSWGVSKFFDDIFQTSDSRQKYFEIFESGEGK